MRKRRILYSPQARDDVARIGRRIAWFASAATASRFVNSIRVAIRKLEYGSERGTIRDEARSIRLIGILPTVSIAFSVDQDTVTIYRVLYNGQNWMPED